MKYKMIAIMAVASLAIAVPSAAADPDLSRPVKLLTPSVVTTEGGSIVHLPPGRFLREDVWGKLDAEARRLQDAETRLAAENASLRKSASGWQPGWRTLLITAASGIALGVYLDRRL